MTKIIIFSFITNIFFYSYGNLFKARNSLNKIDSYNNKSIVGAIIVCFIALLSNFFIPLDKLFNTLVLSFGLSTLIYLKKNKFKKKELFYIFISTLITSLLLAYSNVNRPDAGLYHLPLTSIINEYKIIFGSTNIHFRFGTGSIMQYLSAINNNFIFGNIGIVIPLASLSSFFIIFFFNQVLKIFKKPKNITISNIFCLFILIFISIKMNRYSSFGNDGIAHFSFFYLVAILLKDKKVDLNYISLIAVFILMNKISMALACLFPLIIFLRKFNFKKFKIFYSFSSIFIIIWILKNIIISGCLIYPVKETCFKNLMWTDIKEIKSESISGEAWSKAWPQRLDKELSMKDFNKKFNWFTAWISSHGKYIAKILIFYCSIIFLIIYFISKKPVSNPKKIFIKNEFFFISLIISTLGTFLFFTKFPLFRYGYSYLISLLILFALLFIKNYSEIKLIKLSKIIFYLCISVILTKQVQRYISKHDSTFIWPKIYSYDDNKKIISTKKNITDNFTIFESNGSLCMYSSAPCTNYSLKNNISVKQKYGYFILNIR